MGRAFVYAAVFSCAMLWGWKFLLAGFALALGWHAWYRIAYGRWPPLD